MTSFPISAMRSIRSERSGDFELLLVSTSRKGKRAAIDDRRPDQNAESQKKEGKDVAAVMRGLKNPIGSAIPTG